MESKTRKIEPCHEKNKHSASAETKAQISFAVTAKPMSAFVLATRTIQFLCFRNPKIPASSHLLCLYRWVCVGPVRKPHCLFSHDAVHVCFHYDVILTKNDMHLKRRRLPFIPIKVSFEHVREKTNYLGSDQVRHKPGYTVTETG